MFKKKVRKKTIEELTYDTTMFDVVIMKLIVLVILGLLIYLAVSNFMRYQGLYISSRYSDYCYVAGQHPLTIKRDNIQYFDSLIACNKPLYKYEY